MTQVVGPTRRTHVPLLSRPSLLIGLAIAPLVALHPRTAEGTIGLYAAAVAILATTLLCVSPRPGRRFNLFLDAPLYLAGLVGWFVGLPAIAAAFALVVWLVGHR